MPITYATGGGVYTKYNTISHETAPQTVLTGRRLTTGWGVKRVQVNKSKEMAQTVTPEPCESAQLFNRLERTNTEAQRRLLASGAPSAKPHDGTFGETSAFYVLVTGELTQLYTLELSELYP